MIEPCNGSKPSDSNSCPTASKCVDCGFEDNADVISAINILSRGMQLLRDEGRDTADASVGMRVDGLPASARMACGSNGIGRRKQEPTETTAHGSVHA